MKIEEFRSKLGNMTKDLDKAILPPWRKHQRTMRKELKKHYSGHDLAKKVWKWSKKEFGKKGPSIKNKSPRWSNSNQAWVGKLVVSNLTATIEEGGNLRRHVIFGKKVRTPGLIVSRKPELERVLKRHWPQVTDDVSAELNRYIGRTF